jgi:hypothetical protein
VSCRRPRAKDIRGTTLGSKEIGVNFASIDEAAYYSREDEVVAGSTCSSVAGHCHPEKGYGGNIETPVGAGRSLHPF